MAKKKKSLLSDQASEMARERWRRRTKAERRAHAKKMLEARWGKGKKTA